jgi:ParB-like chromosome segregation protein Spo0J
MLIKYIESEKLLPHELTDSNQVKNVLQSLSTEKILKNAVVVDRDTNLILDGHHRYAALKKL